MFLVTAEHGSFEQFLPENVTTAAAAVGVAWELLRAQGLKVGYVFAAGEERWLAKLELP